MTLTPSIRTLSRIALTAALAAFAGHAAAQFSHVDRLVTFGSSLSDTGGAFVWLSQPGNEVCGVRLNVPPYDRLDDNLTPEGPYARGGHHVTNGATWIEGLARHLSLAGDARTALRPGAGRGSNHAVFGARAGDYPCRYSLPQQVAGYMADFPQTSAETLVALEVGSNDVRDALVAAASGNDPAAVLASAVGSLYAQVTMLHGHGARKFLFVNVPDIGKTPAVRQLDAMFPGLGLAAGATYLSQQYNAALGGVIQYANAIGGEARLLDAYAVLDQVVADPSSYGMVDVEHACLTPEVASFVCKRPDRFVFWDGIHPTAAMHAIVARKAIEVVTAP